MIMNDELFFAWLDDELDPEAAAKVAAEVAADPDLRAKAAAHRSMLARLRSAFEPVMAAPPVAENVVDLAAARARQPQRRVLPSMTQWAAIAATLVVGIVTGTMISGGSPLSVRNDAGQLVAAGQLDRALDTRLAIAPDGSGPRIGLTFRDEAGTICRSFTDGTAQGLACRDGDRWALRGLVQGGNAGSGDYRMAAGIDPALAAMIDARMAGEPFDAAAEQKALSEGWR